MIGVLIQFRSQIASKVSVVIVMLIVTTVRSITRGQELIRAYPMPELTKY